MARKSIKRIGILTGGGDCPGLNAVIRVVTKAAMLKLNLEVFGIEDGYLGLIEGRVRRLEWKDVSGIIQHGGTILGTNNKSDPFRYAVGKDAAGELIFKDVSDQCLATLAQHGIELLICIGGDGTMTTAAKLIERGVPCVGVPKTIDNDLMHTDITFGFTTAVQTATECLDKIHSTGASHHRVMLVELMGRNAGWLTLHAGLASGSDIILIPEIPYSLDVIMDFCLRRSKVGKRFTQIAVSEGAHPIGGQQTVAAVVADSPETIRLGGISRQICRDITNGCGLETRDTILGHVQRGGTPVAYDRVLATAFGHKAIQLVATGEWNNLVVMKGSETSFVPISSVAGQQRQVSQDDPLLGMARAVGTCLGDV